MKRVNMYNNICGNIYYTQFINGKLIARFKEKEPNLSEIYPKIYNYLKK